MKAKFKKLMKNQKGMTLIELLAVIVIIAIIAVIAIPAIGNIINNSHDKAVLADASNIIAGAKLAITDNQCTDNGTSGISCDASALKDHVDGISLTGVTVTLKDDATNGSTYTIVYPRLADKSDDNPNGLRTEKFQNALGYTTNGVTDKKINEVLKANTGNK